MIFRDRLEKMDDVDIDRIIMTNEFGLEFDITQFNVLLVLFPPAYLILMASIPWSWTIQHIDKKIVIETIYFVAVYFHMLPPSRTEPINSEPHH